MNNFDLKNCTYIPECPNYYHCSDFPECNDICMRYSDEDFYDDKLTIKHDTHDINESTKTNIYPQQRLILLRMF